MPRSKPSPEKKSPTDRVRALPWAVILQTAVVLERRWHSLSERDRARLTALLRESRGRMRNLGERERAELRKLAGKIDFKVMGRELLPLARRGRGPGRQKRR